MTLQISDSELELMKIIWSQGGHALYASIMEALSVSGCKWQKNTVITLLSRLVDKGWLQIRKIGRKNEYTSIVSASDFQTLQTTKLIDQVYEGKVQGLVSTLIEQNLISDAEFEELKTFWERGTSHE